MNFRPHPEEVLVSVSSEGDYTVNKLAVAGRGVSELANALQAGAKAGKESVVIIHADAAARHQAVVAVMEAARQAGLSQITFASQASSP
jgi:biopolymer transport protein ExbD